MALPLFADDPPAEPKVPVERVRFYPIRLNTPEYVEYWTWYRNGGKDDAAPNDVPEDPGLTYARRLGYRHGRLFRPLPCLREQQQEMQAGRRRWR